MKEERLNPKMREVLKHLVDYHTDQLLIFQQHNHAGRASAKSRPGRLRLVSTGKRR